MTSAQKWDFLTPSLPCHHLSLFLVYPMSPGQTVTNYLLVSKWLEKKKTLYGNGHKLFLLSAEESIWTGLRLRLCQRIPNYTQRLRVSGRDIFIWRLSETKCQIFLDKVSERDIFIFFWTCLIRRNFRADKFSRKGFFMVMSPLASTPSPLVTTSHRSVWPPPSSPGDVILNGLMSMTGLDYTDTRFL